MGKKGRFWKGQVVWIVNIPAEPSVVHDPQPVAMAHSLGDMAMERAWPVGETEID